MDAWSVVLAVYAHPLVRAVLGLMAANVLAGLAAAFYTRDFHLAAMGDWLLSRAVPYLIGAGAFQLVLLTVPPEWSGVTSAAGSVVWLFVCAALVGHILQILREIGLPVPELLGDKPKAETTASP